MKEGLTSLDTMDMCHVLDARNNDTKSVKFFIVRTVRQCASLRKICERATQNHEVRQTRSWKLLVFFFKNGFVPSTEGGLIQRQRLFDRFLLIEGWECCEPSVNAARRKKRTRTDSIE